MSSPRSRWLVLSASSLLLCLLAAPAAGVVSLDVQITASPEPARPGGDLSYEITVTNTGADPNEPAVDVLIQSFVPESTSLDANGPSDGGTVVGNNIFWSISDLPGAGGQQMVTFGLVVDFPAPGLDSIINGAVVSADNATTVQEIVVTTILPFAVDLTAGAGAGGCAGSPIRTFTAEFVNGSSKSLPGVKLTADIPDFTSLLSAQDGTALCSLDPNLACSAPADCPGLDNSCEVTWDLGTLASEELGSRLLRLSVDDSTPGDKEIVATVVITAGPDEDTASASTTVENIPCLTLEKADAGSVEPGQAMGYRITATNEGRVAATDVLVSDTLPLETQFSKAGLSFESVLISECAGDETGTESAGVVTWNLETLEATETVTVCLELNLDNSFEGSLVLNEAVLTFSGGDPVTASAATEVTTETALKLRMVAEPAPIEIGEQLTFRVSLENIANFNVDQLFISDEPNVDLTPRGCATLDLAATAAANSDPNSCGIYPFDPNGAPAGWQVPDPVVPGGSVDVCLVVTIEGCPGALLRNRVEAKDSRGEIRRASASARIAKDPIALRLFMQRPGRKVKAGDDIQYTLRLQNRLDPNQDLTNVTLTHDLDQVDPNGTLEFLNADSDECDGSGPDGSRVGNVIEWDFDTLPPGEQTVCLLVKTRRTLGTVTILTTAEASDLAGNSAEDSVSTRVFAKALRLRMVDLPDPVITADMEILYKISLDNLGNIPLGPDPFNPTSKDKPIVIKTRVPHGTELICVSGSQVPGKSCEQAADGVTLEKDPFTRKRKLIQWTLDEQLESAAQGAEATRTMWMKVMVKKKRKAIRAKAIAKEFTLRSKSKARALTVIEVE